MRKSDYRVAAYVLTLLVVLAAILYERDALLQPMQKAKSSFQQKLKARHNFSDYKPSTFNPQPFDPNTADSTTLLSLGLPRWMVLGMYKYRAKGGVYQSPEDVARIPGMTRGMYRRLLPYIIIGDDYKPASSLVGPRKYAHNSFSQEGRDTFPRQQKLGKSERINLNTADTALLKKVPGVGSYYAQKIVELRSRYGGFTNVGQLMKIKNFPESALGYMEIPAGSQEKININTASFKRLAQHPYIGYNRTKQIMDYRRLKGRITSLQQLSLLPGFSKEERNLMEEYITY